MNCQRGKSLLSLGIWCHILQSSSIIEGWGGGLIVRKDMLSKDGKISF